jgi:hypothetical protein
VFINQGEAAMLRKSLTHFLKDDRGAFVIILAALMALFVGILALVLDLGHMHGNRSELQHAGDACSLRGARAFFGDDIVPDPDTGLIPGDPDAVQARTAAIAAINQNFAGFNATGPNQLQHLPEADVVFGVWNFQDPPGWLAGPVAAEEFSSVWPPSEAYWGDFIGPGVSVITRREGDYNAGPVQLTLGRIPPVEIESMAARADSVAFLSGVGGFGEGAGEFPICLNKDYVDPVYETIDFSPDNADKGAWTNLTPQSAGDRTDASDFKELFKDCTRLPQALDHGEPISLNNGEMCSATKNLIDGAVGKKDDELCNQYGLELVPVPKDDPDYPNKGNTYRNINNRIYLFPVCDTDEKLNQWHTYGAAPYYIRIVSSSPDPCRIVIQRAPGNYVAPNTSGGGRYYGVLSPQPLLGR